MPARLPSDLEQGRVSSNKDMEEQVSVNPRISQVVFNGRVSQAGRVSSGRVVRFSDRNHADDIGVRIKTDNKIWPEQL
jgi:hypothetical protein